MWADIIKSFFVRFRSFHHRVFTSYIPVISLSYHAQDLGSRLHGPVERRYVCMSTIQALSFSRKACESHNDEGGWRKGVMGKDILSAGITVQFSQTHSELGWCSSNHLIDAFALLVCDESGHDLDVFLLCHLLYKNMISTCVVKKHK